MMPTNYMKGTEDVIFQCMSPFAILHTHCDNTSTMEDTEAVMTHNCSRLWHLSDVEVVPLSLNPLCHLGVWSKVTFFDKGMKCSKPK